DQQFTINTLEVKNVPGHGHHAIFVTNDLDDPQDFDPVLTAIQGDSFNPLWEQIKIIFNAGVAPRQFTSDTEVEDAATAGEDHARGYGRT
ncbi:MAG TPA: hypothetical protein VJS69_02330, partial [Candidatus Krumholzibacteria bacterium]|nr:hypothetical protein [Candidatus Krumholzibacteria bacterium]